MSCVHLQYLIKTSAVLPLSSHDWVEGIVEPLHCQVHHLSQGVVLHTVVRAADRLRGGGTWSRKIFRNISKPAAWCTSPILLLTLVSKQIWTVLPSTVTEMFLSSLKSTQSSPNISLKRMWPNINCVCWHFIKQKAFQTHWFTDV